jgi:polyferredoxin
MDKIGRPARLIAYDTDLNIQARLRHEPSKYDIVRPRTVLYAAVIAAVASIMLYALATRHAEAVSVIHDRNPVFVRMADGAIRNAYTVRIVNKRLEQRRFMLAVTGLPGSLVDVVGGVLGGSVIEVGPDQTREVRVLLTDYNDSRPHSTPISFHIRDLATGERASAADHFRGPQ